MPHSGTLRGAAGGGGAYTKEQCICKFCGRQAVGYQEVEVTPNSPTVCNQTVCKVHWMVEKRNPLLKEKYDLGLVPFKEMDFGSVSF